MLSAELTKRLIRMIGYPVKITRDDVSVDLVLEGYTAQENILIVRKPKAKVMLLLDITNEDFLIERR